jgi:hypothetical protein
MGVSGKIGISFGNFVMIHVQRHPFHSAGASCISFHLHMKWIEIAEFKNY